MKQKGKTMATFSTYRNALFIHGREFSALDACELVRDYLDPNTLYNIEWTDVDGCDGGCIRNVEPTEIPRYLCEIRRTDSYAYIFILTPRKKEK